MKIFISADMEGICGIVSDRQTIPGDREYERGQRLMTADVNAVIEGAVQGGATEIVVNDSHGPMRNLLIELLHPAAQLISGSPKPLSMMQGLDESFQAVFLVGYHAQAGTGNAILDHTFSGRIYQVAINDIVLGEMGLNAALAGYWGVPVRLVTGDTVLAEQTRQLLGPVEVVAVKEAYGRTAAKCLPLQEAYQRLTSAAQRALEHTGQPFALPKGTAPYTLQVDFQRSSYADMAEMIPASRRTGPRRVEFDHADYMTIYKVWRTMVALAALADA